MFTTAFKNINRHGWSNGQDRTIELYIEHFLNLAKTIDYHLVVYVESDMLQKLLSYSLPSNIQLEDINTVDTS